VLLRYPDDAMFLPTLVLLLQSFVTPALTTKDIPRFETVGSGVYRGGQPGREGFEYLKKNGIKTVINLRTDNDEEAIVKELGMNYVHIPISIKFWSKIPSPAIDEYFKVLNDPANYPIFFHCKRGADRTGALAGFYRIAVQGWEPEKAYDEAREIGMRWWYPAIKQQIRTFKKQPAPFLKTAVAEP
jgi:tyrosine-protein phosphatase SIW14